MRLNIDKEHKELKAHGNYAFPVLVSDERLSWFDTGEFPWHWHPEIELTIVLDGNMTYLVNDNEYILRAGEGLFCNTNVLHSGKHYDTEDCSYLSITFHPRLLYGYTSSLMQSKYMERKIYNNLLEWKKNSIKTPLMIIGARQIGKTYIIKQFGKN